MISDSTPGWGGNNGAVIIYMSLYQTQLYSNHFPTIFFLSFAVGVYYTHIFITRKKNQAQLALPSYTRLICKTAVHLNNYASVGLTKSYNTL